MGWSGGTDVVIEVATAIRKHVRDSATRRILYKVLVDSCEAADWDCQNEACGIDPILDGLLQCGEEEA